MLGGRICARRALALGCSSAYAAAAGRPLHINSMRFMTSALRLHLHLRFICIYTCALTTTSALRLHLDLRFSFAIIIIII